VLVVLLARRWSTAVLVVLCVAGAACSALALAAAYRPEDPGAAYYRTDTRAASLLLGAALAALLDGRAHRVGPLRARRRSPARVLLGAVAWAGVVVVGWQWTHADGTGPALYYGGMAVTALAVAAVITHVALLPDGLVARGLSLPPLPALGRISYGVYLWHWPLFLAVNAERTGLQGWPLFALRCALTLAVAVVSYVVVETPVRSGALFRRTAPTLGAAAAGMAAVTGAVVVLTQVDGATPGAAVAGAPAVDGLDLAPVRPGTAPADAPRAREAHVRGGPAGRDGRRHAAVVPRNHVRPGETVRVDVFGDSVAWSLVVYLPSEHPGLVFNDRTSLGCGITTTAPYRYFGTTYAAVMPKCRDWPERWRRAVVGDDPDIALVLVGRWETMDRVLDGRWTHIGEPAFDTHLRAELDRAITIAGSRGARVVLATEPYNRRGERPDGGIYPEDQPERVARWNDLLRSVAARHPGVRVLELGQRISPDGRFSWTAGGVQVRADGLHLTPEGVQQWVAPWLLPRLRALAP